MSVIPAGPSESDSGISGDVPLLHVDRKLRKLADARHVAPSSECEGIDAVGRSSLERGDTLPSG
jgi:hypothetical protein